MVFKIVYEFETKLGYDKGYAVDKRVLRKYASVE